jgi:hypothetical protein
MRGITRLALPAIVAAGLTIMAAGPASAAVPTNDDFANASVISVTPFTDAVNTTDATTQATDSTGCGGSHSVWYAYTASHSGTLSFDTSGSDFDTLLSAYTGTEGSLTLVACNDDANSTLQSQVSFDVTSGTTYHFMVGGCCRPEDGVSGDVVVHADVTGPPFEFDVSFTGGFADPKTHAVTIEGTVVCTDSGVVEIVGGLRQRQTDGSFSTETACSPDVSTFTVAVTASAGAFMPGKATMHDVVISGCGTNGCDTQSLPDAETTVKLHPQDIGSTARRR